MLDLSKVNKSITIKYSLLAIGSLLLFILTFGDPQAVLSNGGSENFFSLNNLFTNVIGYFLPSLGFVVLGIASFYYYTDQFVERRLPQIAENPTGQLMFRLMILLSAINTLIVFDLFLPAIYPSYSIVVLILLSKQNVSITSQSLYIQYLSNLLLLLLVIQIIVLIILFYIALLQYSFLRLKEKSYIAWSNTKSVFKLLSLILSLPLLIYLWFYFITEQDQGLKFLTLFIVLLLVLWLVYFITTRIYYDSLLEFNSKLVIPFIQTFSLLYIIPVLYWFFHDLILLNVYKTTTKTVFIEFTGPLAKLNLGGNSSNIDALLLNMVAFNRIFIFQAVLILLTGLFLIAMINAQFITKSLAIWNERRKVEKSRVITKELDTVSLFIHHLFDNRMLSSLFFVFIGLVFWDSFLVLFSLIKSILSHGSPADELSFLFFTQSVTWFNKLPNEFTISLIFFLFVLFVTVIVIYNTRAIENLFTLRSKSDVVSTRSIHFIILFLITSGIALINLFLVYNILETPSLVSELPIEAVHFSGTYPFSLKVFSRFIEFHDSLFLLVMVVITAFQLRKHIRPNKESNRNQADQDQNS